MIPLKDDNPTSGKPIISYGIIGFCVLIFLAQLGLSEEELRDFTYSYGLIPSVLMGIDQLPSDLFKISPIGTIFTSMFMTEDGCILLVICCIYGFLQTTLKMI